MGTGHRLGGHRFGGRRRGILDYFRHQVERAGGGNYQTVINNVLRDYIEAEPTCGE